MWTATSEGQGMTRLTALLSALLLAIGLMAGSALAHEHVPEHPHAMLHNFEVVDDGGTPNDPSDDVIAFDRCIDLANNQALPLEAHHHSLHTGTAGFGDVSVGITRAGHIVVPLEPYPFSPFEDCAEIEAFFGS